MTLLLIKCSKNNYEILSPSTYGMKTWGHRTQDSLIKKRKYWYIESWQAGQDYCDDQVEYIKLNVVLETTDIDEIMRYVYNHEISCGRKLIKDYQEIIKDWISFESNIWDNIEGK